jgi:beta-glucanase (GH16 family)
MIAMPAPHAAAILIGGLIPPLVPPWSSAAEPGENPPPAPAGFRWEPVPELTDEFNTAGLDTSKWRPGISYWQGREPSRFAPENVSVSGGMLRLRSTSLVKDLSSVKHPGKDIWVASAAVSSKERRASCGYYEARIKASRLSMTSSFWFQGKYSEIDVVEQMGAPAKDPDDRNFMLMNTHSFANGWDKDEATPVRWRMPAGSADDFHVYGVWWKDKDTVWFYHNGTKVAEVRPKCAFAEPMFLFFDTEVFTWSGLPSIASLEDPAGNTMLVDWVRSWKLVDQAPR